MLFTVIGFFVIAAVISLVVHMWGKCPLWVAVLCLCVVELCRLLPMGR